MNTIDNDMLVSIIIPMFNVSPFLVEALDSVIHQTYRNLEIIVIDDGSTDASGKICDEYAKKDARVVVIHQENKGLITARNMGLNRMSGEMVAFLDSDDAYPPKLPLVISSFLSSSSFVKAHEFILCEGFTSEILPPKIKPIIPITEAILEMESVK